MQVVKESGGALFWRKTMIRLPNIYTDCMCGGIERMEGVSDDDLRRLHSHAAVSNLALLRQSAADGASTPHKHRSARTGGSGSLLQLVHFQA